MRKAWVKVFDTCLKGVLHMHLYVHSALKKLFRFDDQHCKRNHVNWKRKQEHALSIFTQYNQLIYVGLQFTWAAVLQNIYI